MNNISKLFFVPLFCVMISCHFKEEKHNPGNVSEVIEKIQWNVTEPPGSLGLEKFYKKYIYVNGIHIISSKRVPDSALFAASDIIMFMTEALQPEVLQELTKRNTRVAVMSRYEGTTDIPEHAYLANDTSLNWDVRARGLGGDIDLPLTSCAEENLLCYQIDKYHAEDILIHEFAHTIHGVGILTIDPQFNDKLKELLELAVSMGKWERTYAKTNVWEYWAEGVQDWFNVNAEVPFPDGTHNHVNTRSELKEYDEGLYQLIAGYFSDTMALASCHCKPYVTKN
jgi:alpha-glucosidase